MKARLFSWLLVMILVFESIGLETAFASVKDADPVSVDTMAEEDVTITTTDVPYHEVEWYESSDEAAETQASGVNPEYQIAMVLDVSGSMSGTPMQELKQACYNFIDDILNEDETAEIAIVTFESDVTAYKFGGEYFTNDRAALRAVVAGLTDGGSTAMNAGMRKADEILQNYGTASTRFLIQMADGMPNMGDSYYGEDAKYAGTHFVDPDGNEFEYTGDTGDESAVYNTFWGIKDYYNIFSLGFFHELDGVNKQFAATFMNDIQNVGYHEVVNADDLVFSFESIAQTIGSDYLVLNKSNLALAKGDVAQLAVAFTDAYTSTDKTVTWKSSDINVAKVDSTGQVTAVGEGRCNITAEAGGHSIRCAVTVGKSNEKNAEELKLYIYENKNGVEKAKEDLRLSVGATVEFNGNTYKSGDDGCVIIPAADRGEIIVSKSGYSSRTMTCDKLKDGMKIVLQQLSDNPTINAVWIDDVDILTDDYPMELMETASTTITVDVTWGKGARSKIQLAQEATFVDFPANSNTLSMVLKDKFDISKDMYIVVTDANGNAVKKKLLIENTKSVEGLEGLELSFGDGVGLTLPEKLPLVGGKPIDLDVPSVLPISASVDGDKVYVTIGVDVAGYSYSDKYATSAKTKNRAHHIDRETQNLYKSIKDIKGTLENTKQGLEDSKKDVQKSIKALKNLKQKYGTAMKMPQGSFGFDADFTILGYAEGYVDENNKFQFLDGGVILVPAISLDWSGQFAIGPVPCYWEAQIAAEIQAQLNLLKNQNAKQFLSSGKLGGKLSGSLGAGVGVNKVATIGGGGTLTFEPSVTFYPSKKNYFAMTTTINAYFKVKVAFLEYKWEPEALKKSWTVDNGVESISAENALREMYTQAEYEQENLDYLDAEDEDVTEEDSIFTILKANAYSQTEPKLAAFDDGRKLAVWVDAAGADANLIRVYYSYYDGSQWSEPAVIEEDGTPDFSPEVHVAGKYAYITWQDMDRAVTAEDTLDTVAEIAGIRVAVFDNQIGMFDLNGTQRVVSGNGILDMMPIVTGDENTMSVVWVRNTDNNWFGASTDAAKKANTIYAKTYKDGEWGQETALYQGLSAITGIAADYDTNTLNIAYTMDEDADMTTSEDVKLWLNGERVTQSESMEAAPQFANHELYWYGDGMFRCMEDLASKEIADIKADSGVIAVDNYQVVGSSADKAIVYTVANGIATSFYGIFYQTEKDVWGQPVCLTDLEKAYAVSDFSAASDANNNIDVLCNRTEVFISSDNPVSEESYGQTDVAMFTYESGYGLTIEDCVYDPEAIVAGSALPMTIELQNSGTESVEGVLVEILDQDNKVLYNVEVNESLLSGEKKEINVSYIVQAADIGKDITVKCSPLKHAMAANDKNTYTITMSFEDLAISGLGWGYKDDTTISIYGSVNNNGYSAASNVKVSLHLGAADGEKIAEYAVATIPSMNRADILFHVPYEAGTVYYVVVSELEKEHSATNNIDYIVTGAEEEVEERVVSSIQASMAKTTYEVGDALDISTLAVKALYTDGTQSDISKQAVVNTSAVNMSVAGSYTITISYEGKTASIAITVNEKKVPETPAPEQNPTPAPAVKVGQQVTSKTAVYQITSVDEKNRTAKVVKSTVKTKSLKSLTIPSTVNVEGVSYTVTEIGNNAYKNKTSLKKVTIPATVKKIGSGAFQGCKNLKTIKIKSKSLTSIGKNAFKGIHKKAAFKVPSSKLKKYKKMISKKNVGYKKTWKIKK